MQVISDVFGGFVITVLFNEFKRAGLEFLVAQSGNISLLHWYFNLGHFLLGNVNLKILSEIRWKQYEEIDLCVKYQDLNPCKMILSRPLIYDINIGPQAIESEFWPQTNFRSTGLDFCLNVNEWMETVWETLRNVIMSFFGERFFFCNVVDANVQFIQLCLSLFLVSLQVPLSYA